MAGGKWTAQNKVRPGAYINFVGVPKPSMTVGDRGIATLAMELDWGEPNKLIPVESMEFITGEAYKKIGLKVSDEKALPLKLMLSNCYKALVYRSNGGAKATATIAPLTATAKYAGTFGNNIDVSVTGKSAPYSVNTFVNNELKDTQKATNAAELIANDWVVFSGTGALVATAGTPLTGGTNGTAETDYSGYLNALKTAKWQTMAVLKSSENSTIDTFIKMMIEEDGRSVQAILNGYAGDYEGLICLDSQALTIDNIEVSAQMLTAWVAGVTAGANINESNTYKVVQNATAINPTKTNTEIIAALKDGKLVFSSRQDGAIVIEQDINSLHNFTQTKGYAFSKNRVIRTIDEIRTTVADTFERSYIGKINNNAAGRAAFRADIVNYLTTLQGLNAIQEFNGAEDVMVMQGEAIDSVLVEIAVKMVDSMEKMYLTVSVGG